MSRRFTPFRHKAWPFLAAWLVYSTCVVGFVSASYRANDDHLVYALDDPYIHMAIAKHLVKFSTFGVTPYEFSFSSSSPLWTCLLAGVYFVFGVSNWPPLFLNYVFGTASLLLISRFGFRAGLRGSVVALLLLADLLLTPMIPLTFTGMEHMLHVFAALLFMYFLWALLSTSGPSQNSHIIALCLAAMLAVATRYESLFLVAAAVFALALKRRWTAIPLCAVCGVIPVLLFGAFSVAHGQHFLPNALLLKGNMPALNTAKGIIKLLGYDGLQNLVACPHLYALVLCMGSLYVWRQGRHGDAGAGDMLLLAVLAATALHLEFAKTGWFYRYEGYLVTLAVTALFVTAHPVFETGWVRNSRSVPAGVLLSVCVLIALVLFPMVKRSATAHRETIPATRNIYQQQYQMGLFLQEFYDAAPVAANDIGAINYLANIRCLDLTGLGSEDVIRERRNGRYATDVIRGLSRDRGVRIAVVYMQLFGGETGLPPLPAEWTPVGTWRIDRNVVCAGDTVTFLATQRSEVPVLSANLRSFSCQLPNGVVWKDLVEGDATEASEALDARKARPLENE